MADVASNIYDWSTTASSNSPSDATTIGAGLADNFQQIQATVRAAFASKGADIASATTTDIGAVTGKQHDITGTTTITSFGTVAAGIEKVLQFDGALTLTHSGNLILPGAVNITTVAGDVGVFVSEGSGVWRCISFVGKNVAGTNGVFSGTLNVTGATTLSGTLTAAAINASGLVAMAGAATVGTTLGVTGAITTPAAVNITAGAYAQFNNATNDAIALIQNTGGAGVTVLAVTAASTTFSGTLGVTGALTYGGVTLSAGVTGTGNMVLNNSPAFQGTVTGSGSLNFQGNIIARGATAIPAGGTTGAGLMVSSTANFGVFFGSGAPSLDAAKGSLYLRSDGTTTNNRMYVNTDGAGTWTAVTTAA